MLSAFPQKFIIRTLSNTKAAYLYDLVLLQPILASTHCSRPIHPSPILIILARLICTSSKMIDRCLWYISVVFWNQLGSFHQLHRMQSFTFTIHHYCNLSFQAYVKLRNFSQTIDHSYYQGSLGGLHGFTGLFSGFQPYRLSFYFFYSLLWFRAVI